MSISKIEQIIFIGVNRYGENGPLSSFIKETTKNNSYFWIACNGGGLKVPYLKSYEMYNIKLGRRFITPHFKLDEKGGLKQLLIF